MGNEQQNKLRKSDSSFLMQGSILAIASIVSRVIGLIYRIPLTNIIGKMGNDYYGTAYEIYNLLLIISSYSIPLAVSKVVAAKMANQEHRNAFRVLKGALAFAAVSGGLAGLIVYFGADFLTGELLKTPYAAIALRVLAPTLFIVAIVGVLRGFFQGLGSMIPSAVSQIMEQIVNAIISVAAAYTLFSFGGRVAADRSDTAQVAAAYGAAGGTLGTTSGSVMALLVMLFIFLAFLPGFFRRMAREKTGTVSPYSGIMRTLVLTIVPVLLSTTIYNIVLIIDQGIFKNLAVLQGIPREQISSWWGVYTGEYRVIQNVPISIASAIGASAVPTLTMAFHAGKMDLVKRQLENATRFVMLVAIPSAVGLAVLARPIMLLLFRDPDPTSAMMMVVGGLTIVFVCLSTLSNSLLQGIDHLNLPIIHSLIATGVQALFLVVAMLVFHLGIYGLIMAYTVDALLISYLNHRSIMKYAAPRPLLKETYILPLAASAIMGLAVFLAYRLAMLSHSNLLATFFAVVVGAFVYFIAIIRLGAINEETLLRFPKGSLLVGLAKKMHLM